MTERLNLEGLRYAQAVTETGSFSAAARAYGVTQPALSNGVARLEDRLGEKLFTRTPRGVTATSFGNRILPLIDRALAALDDVAAEAQRWTAPVAGSIRMGVSPLINPKLVARARDAIGALPTPPESRQLVLREANMAELQDALVTGELDIVVIPSVGPLPRYEHRVIDSEPLVLVEASSEPGGGTDDPAPLPELAGKELILMPDTCGLTTFTRDLLSSRDLPMRPYPGEASSYRVLEEWSSLGLGAAMLPESKLTDPQTAHRQVLDEDGNVVEIFYEAVWNPRAALAPDLAGLADRMTTPRP
ncbi:MAG: LysR family transcriptional regulator [Acidipropionibacterium sp.]|jgi:DNA-binding transcriptional LysR family regulator|nr:LysR family transcriptional regulator [Acidipropionibacterium sp.]